MNLPPLPEFLKNRKKSVARKKANITSKVIRFTRTNGDGTIFGCDMNVPRGQEVEVTWWSDSGILESVMYTKGVVEEHIRTKTWRLVK